MSLIDKSNLDYFAQKLYAKIKSNFDTKGSGSTAETNAKTYTDGLNTAMNTRVNTLEDVVGDASIGLVKDVAVLKGDKTTTGSVAYQIAQIIANAPENFDTLKEIADWIANDTTNSTKMANDISTLKTLVGTLPSDATSTDIVNYIAEYISNSAITETEIDSIINSLS